MPACPITAVWLASDAVEIQIECIPIARLSGIDRRGPDAERFLATSPVVSGQWFTLSLNPELYGKCSKAAFRIVPSLGIQSVTSDTNQNTQCGSGT